MKVPSLLSLLAPLCVGIGVGNFCFPTLTHYYSWLILATFLAALFAGNALFRQQSTFALHISQYTLTLCLGTLLFVHQQRGKTFDLSQLIVATSQESKADSQKNNNTVEKEHRVSRKTSEISPKSSEISRRELDTSRKDATLSGQNSAIDSQTATASTASAAVDPNSKPFAPQSDLTFRGVVTDVPRRTPQGWNVRLRMLAPHEGEMWQCFLVDTTATYSDSATATHGSTATRNVPNTTTQTHDTATSCNAVAPQSSGKTLRIGTQILGHGRIRPLLPPSGRVQNGYAAYLLRQNIVASTYCFDKCWKVSQVAAPLSLREQWLLHRETWIARYRQQLPPHTAAVLAAMTLASRQDLDHTTQQRYSQSGASHVLALSGLHLSILFGAFTLILGTAARRLGRQWQWCAAAIALLLMWMFAAFVGFPISLVRATLMLTLAQLLFVLHHRPGALHGLLLSMILMLIYAPDWLFDVGFQLSCTAVGGILLLTPKLAPPSWMHPVSHRAAEITNRNATSSLGRIALWMMRTLYTLLVVSFSAQLATAPLVAYYFHQLPWAGVLTSLFVIPSAYVLLIGGFLFLLCSPLQPFLSVVLTQCLEKMEHGLSFFSQGVFAPIPLFPTWRTVVAFYIALCFLLWLHQAHRLQRLHFLLRCGLLLLCVLTPVLSYTADRIHARPRAAAVIYATPGITALHCIAPNGHSWLFASDTLRAQHALYQQQHEDWDPQDLRVTWLPLSLLPTSSATAVADESSTPIVAGRCVTYGQLRIAIIDAPLSYAFPEAPLNVDILFVGHDVHRPLAHILSFYHPKQLVLSAAMTDYYRTSYLSDAAQAHISCYDLSENPTLTLSIDTKQ